MRCKNCHYSLLNLTEHRCPECGTAFDPNDPSTFDTDTSRRSRALRRAILWIMGVYLGTFAIMLAYSAFFDPSGVKADAALITGLYMATLAMPLILIQLGFSLLKGS